MYCECKIVILAGPTVAGGTLLVWVGILTSIVKHREHTTQRTSGLGFLVSNKHTEELACGTWSD